MSITQQELERIVTVPEGWVDLPSFESFEKTNPGIQDWTKLYHLYTEEVIKPWLYNTNNLFWEEQENLEYEYLDDSHHKRVQSGGVINLFCGPHISFLDKNTLGYIPTSVPIDNLVTTMNILPLIVHSQSYRENFQLSELYNTENKAVVTGTGILLPPGEQIMMYCVEKINMPQDYIGQATTKSGIGRRGLDTVATAGTFNKGWKGIPLLEFNNRNSAEPILLEIGVSIAQFYLIDASHSEGQYTGQFQNQSPK